MFTTLISPDELASLPIAPDYAVIDCRFDLSNPGAGERDYERSHIPGAVYAHLDRDLSGEKTGINGRHPLPRAEDLAATLGLWGIGAGVQVVAYDAAAGMFASRLWWLLRYLGHDAVAVLDGGWPRWLREGRPVNARVEQRRPATTFTARPRVDMLVTVDDVRASLADPAIRLVDARAPNRYRGEVEPLDLVAGHIPGAVNRHYQRNVTPDGAWRPGEELRRGLREAIGDVEPGRVIAYCGSGVSACHNLLAFERAGLHGAKLYAGSWSEWSADPARPVETGDAKVGGGKLEG
jgi:thiosulfate/3-mercaptopyruvate sulfurtransferase